MEVELLQVVFTPPKSSNNKEEYGVPDNKKAWNKAQQSGGAYTFHTHDRCGSCHTHDRCGSCEPGPFYQIAFRIKDYRPYKKGDIGLTLRNEQMPETVSNDLFYDEKSDLWYQRSKYKKTKNGEWKLIPEDKSGAMTAESITASGAFKVYAYLKETGQRLRGKEYDIPWIYVLPSSVEKEDYLRMLSELIPLNEDLVRKKGSSTGIGAAARTETETGLSAEIKLLRNERNKTDELTEAIRRVMALPSELLGKKYVKTGIHKIKRFDAKIMRDYVKCGGSGKVSGIEYFENHDTYENRIIKYVLQKIRDYVENSPIPTVLSDEDIESRASDHIKRIQEMGKSERIAVDKETRHLEIKKSLKKENEQRKDALALFESRKRLVKLLDDKWFKHITDLTAVSEIKPTQKFIANRYYSRIYKILTTQFIDKPFVSASFDINAFGVVSTHYVYEYWVLLKLLNKLLSLGFAFENGDELKNHFQHFTKKGELKPMIIPMLRKAKHHEVKIEVGYRVLFKGTAAEQKEPDYYIRVINKKGRDHWYFMDAKYKNFTMYKDFVWSDKPGVFFAEEIYKVAFQKYISCMGKIFSENPKYASKEEDIRGSYIIMAGIDDKRELADNDRLFGNRDVRHRYGAILLTPTHDDELTTLLQLIFEYLETDNNKKHPNLDWCWRCGSTDVINTPCKTANQKNDKYYTVCPECGDFRVITNCIGGSHVIIKHDRGNYHCRDKEKWAFVCPRCGNTL